MKGHDSRYSDIAGMIQKKEIQMTSTSLKCKSFRAKSYISIYFKSFEKNIDNFIKIYLQIIYANVWVV